MKKIAKISLVAAIAVAGLTTANAQPLEEAIKNVEVSGSVVYRYNNRDDSAARGTSATSDNNYKVATTLASKVNEDVKFNSRFLVAGANAGLASLDTETAADQTVGVALSNAYFGYTGVKNTTVNVGKQGLTTPWTVAVDSDNNEQTGTGILALSTMGPVTLAGAYFNQTNLGRSGGFLTDALIAPATQGANISELDIATVGAIAAVGPVTIDAWYLDLESTFDTFTLGAKADFTPSNIKVGTDARYTRLSLDAPGAKDQSLAKVAVTADAGLIDGKVAYAKTGKDGGLVALDIDAATNLLGWNLSANNATDADYWQLVAGVDVLSNLNLSANYGNLKYTGNMEAEEIYAQLLYKMSKNLSTYVRYGEYTVENTSTNVESIDATVGRLQVEYTF